MIEAMLVVRLSARLAMLLLPLSLTLIWSQRSPGDHRVARALWTAGYCAFVVHFIAVFQLIYHWSHAAAFRDVAEQTRQMTGMNSGKGIYLNYLFLLVWGVDVLAWWTWRDRWRRSNPVRLALYGFMFFMAFNASLVFVRPASRWVGILVLILLAVVFVRRRRNIVHP